MKKTKRLFSLILVLALVFSTFATAKFSAATTDTRYSLKHIQNGGFDENVSKYTFSSNYSQPKSDTVPYWDTTAFEGKFEFFKGGSAHFDVTRKKYPDNPEYIKVAEKEVAAELNADEVSTIYQRIETISGSTYTWGLYHRGRDVTDRMVLIIGPEQPVDPSKPSKTGNDQFVRITNWLKAQYGIEYPEIGCSQKFTVYSKPFDVSGKFLNEDTRNENNNISLVETEEINQEWSVWVISSPYCNTAKENTKNGWSAYGINANNDFDDVIKGASSSLGYDCTYTVPKGQTKTIFAFCSYESGRSDGKDSSTYGNLLDGIKFELYQPFSSSTTPGGIGGAEIDNIKITSGITHNNSMHRVVRDGEECTLYTKAHDDKLTDCTFVGAYVTTSNPDGTTATEFRGIYQGSIEDLTEEELDNYSKTHFIEKSFTDTDGEIWSFYTQISVEAPISIHLVYTKAPYVLYDANGGMDYHFSPDNEMGDDLVGFANAYKTVEDKDGNLIDTSDYYANCQYTTASSPDEEVTVIQEGKYTSHAALPNENWEKDENGSSCAKFCGWSVSDTNGKKIILDGVHTITYNPKTGNGGIITIKDAKNNISDLQLDATHGVTLSAVWKFTNRAQAQTCNENGVFENSAVGGTVKETLIHVNKRAEEVKEYTDGSGRVERVDATCSAGEKIMFKATPDYQNNYAFVGWYYREKQADGTYAEKLRTTSTSIAVTVEEGKLNTYYARFQKQTVSVVFKYTETGSKNNYDFYCKSADHQYGAYYQDVFLGKTAVKPSGDPKQVKTWFTSPTERSAEYIFDFSTPITEETVLYAGPSVAFNYFNYFKLAEPWYVNTYSTIKVGGKYIDLKNDPDVTDCNVYMLKGSLGETAPSSSAVKNNKRTVKGGMKVDSDKLIYNALTNTNQTFYRAGAAYNNFYLFNMKTPVWVVFDFTYKGVKYTSSVKDRCLYNDITTYMAEAENGYYTDFPPETQAALKTAQVDLLNSIQGLYDASPKDITEPSAYADGVKVNELTYNESATNPYTFSSTTAIRNIEPWGLKYSFAVNDHNFSEFSDYGAVILTDKEGDIEENSVTVNELLSNKESVMYSKANSNIYSGNTGAEVYHVNNMFAIDFNKDTYAVFFVKDSDGNTYFSNIVSNTYNKVAQANDSVISRSIITYSNALIAYNDLLTGAEEKSKASSVLPVGSGNAEASASLDGISSYRTPVFEEEESLEESMLGDKEVADVETAYPLDALSKTPVSEIAATEGFELGDVDFSGSVNVKDATLIQKATARLAQLTDEARALADVNADNKVNVTDATTIQKYLSGIIKDFGGSSKPTEPSKAPVQNGEWGEAVQN